MELYKVYTGKEFNELNKITNNIYIKLTSKDGIHNGYQFKEGLNEDTMQFNPTGNCTSGGIYFCALLGYSNRSSVNV